MIKNRIKKAIAGLVIGTVLVTTSASAIEVRINNNPIIFDVAPMMINDRTMVPMRAIFESLGADVQWNEATRSITATRAGDMVVLTIGSTIMTVNGSTITLDAAPVVVSDRTMVPVRAISEALGSKVSWEEATETAKITDNSGLVNPEAFTKYAVNNAVELVNYGASNNVSHMFNGEFSFDADNDGIVDAVSIESYVVTSGVNPSNNTDLHVNYGTFKLGAGSSVGGVYSAHMIDVDTSDNAKEFLVNLDDMGGLISLIRYENGTFAEMTFPTSKRADETDFRIYPEYIASVECFGNGQFTIITDKGNKIVYKETARGSFVKQ